MKKNLLILFLLIAVSAAAQFQYKIDQSIPVAVNGKSISMPWAGGLNSSQVNMMDLNGDKKEDIVIYDKGVGKIWTFVRNQNSYQYAPEYESLFPQDINSFLLLRDYNGDGKKDIFTFNYSENGISVYKNVTEAGQNLSWQLFTYNNKNFTSPSILRYINTSGLYINILPGTDDIPNIRDMDGDGDLDILNMKFVNPMEAEFQENISTSKDTLIFKRHTRWGNWQDCSCGSIAFGTTCPTGGRTEHQGGKALLTFDIDNDGDQDLLYTEETCSQLYFMRNEGTGTDALMKSFSIFPTSSPINFYFFPSPFLEDVDGDGLADLVISPNINSRTVFNTDFNHSLWFYKNTGTAQLPNFTLVKKNFLQEDMIDVGDNSAPAFFDYDGDGDLDLFIGSFTSDDFSGRIFLYENTGTATSPTFRFVTDDFASMSLLSVYNIKPQFVDVDSNGTIDLTFTATDFIQGITSLYYIKNKSDSKFDISSASFTKTTLTIASTENVFLADVDQDGIVDALVGKSIGALQYLQNVGPAGSFNFITKNQSYLNLGITTSRQNLSIAIADLDADGSEDLITGDQTGALTIYNNFRSATTPTGTTNLIYDSLKNDYVNKNLGGRVWPAVANLYNGNKPMIAVGNTAGGLYLLKNENSDLLPDEPVILLSPNPLPKGTMLNIKSDRNATLQIFSIIGQKMCEPIAIPANQSYDLSVQNLATGVYIARFVVKGKSYGKRFMVE